MPLLTPDAGRALTSSVVHTYSDYDLAQILLSFLRQMSRDICYGSDTRTEIAGGDSVDPPNPLGPACYVASEATRTQLMTALEFLVDEDYFFFVDSMIIWLRKAVDDLAGCTAQQRGYAERLRDQLNAVRDVSGYYVDLLDNYETNKVTFGLA